MNTNIIVVDPFSNDFKNCMQIRKIVFTEGQNVPEDIEIDGLDENSTHFMLSVNDISVGTARVRYVGTEAKIERVAILPSYQGLGLGQQLMEFIINNIQNSNSANSMILSSQLHAIPFYERLGFNVCSTQYMDAGIPHKDMKRTIEPA